MQQITLGTPVIVRQNGSVIETHVTSVGNFRFTVEGFPFSFEITFIQDVTCRPTLGAALINGVGYTCHLIDDAVRAELAHRAKR